MYVVQGHFTSDQRVLSLGVAFTILANFTLVEIARGITATFSHDVVFEHILSSTAAKSSSWYCCLDIFDTP